MAYTDYFITIDRNHSMLNTRVSSIMRGVLGGARAAICRSYNTGIHQHDKSLPRMITIKNGEKVRPSQN